MLSWEHRPRRLWPWLWLWLWACAESWVDRCGQDVWLGYHGCVTHTHTQCMAVPCMTWRSQHCGCGGAGAGHRGHHPPWQPRSPRRPAARGGWPGVHRHVTGGWGLGGGRRGTAALCMPTTTPPCTNHPPTMHSPHIHHAPAQSALAWCLVHLLPADSKSPPNSQMQAPSMANTSTVC